MHSRQRFELTLQHLQPDRPPIDIGGTSLTGMRPVCQQRLRDLLGFSGKPIPANNAMDERLLRWAGTDFRSVGAIIDLPNPAIDALDDPELDCWGIRRQRVDGESQITRYPLKGATLADLSAYPWPQPHLDETQLLRWQAEAKALRQQDEFVVIAEHPVYGILELGCWMCGYDDFLMRMLVDKDFVRAFFDKVFSIQMQIIEQYYPALAPYIDLTTSGDDFGMQTGPLISPRTFQELVAPYFTERIQRTKELGQCHYWHHSCGSVFALLDQLIACGVELLNPIQTSAAHMDPQGLKDSFGKRLVFWGGVDVQQFLPRATPEQVRQRVQELVHILGRQGGYVIAPAHEMQADIPPENIAAWVESMRV